MTRKYEFPQLFYNEMWAKMSSIKRMQEMNKDCAGSVLKNAVAAH